LGERHNSSSGFNLNTNTTPTTQLQSKQASNQLQDSSTTQTPSKHNILAPTPMYSMKPKFKIKKSGLQMFKKRINNTYICSCLKEWQERERDKMTGYSASSTNLGKQRLMPFKYIKKKNVSWNFFKLNLFPFSKKQCKKLVSP
jgi:hypothetical protein